MRQIKLDLDSYHSGYDCGGSCSSSMSQLHLRLRRALDGSKDSLHLNPVVRKAIIMILNFMFTAMIRRCAKAAIKRMLSKQKAIPTPLHEIPQIAMHRYNAHNRSQKPSNCCLNLGIIIRKLVIRNFNRKRRKYRLHQPQSTADLP
jgi:hypothetical protein